MKYWLLCIGLLLSLMTASQDLENCKKKLHVAKTDRERVVVLDSLAIYYTVIFQGSQDSLADRYSEQALAIAEQSGNKELKAYALLRYGQRFVASWSSAKKLDSVLKSALQFAQENNLPFYQASAYQYLALSNPDKGLEYANLAQNIATSLANDSLKTEATLAMGLIFQGKKNSLAAFRNYALALYEAEQIDNMSLQMVALGSLSHLYYELKDYTKALTYAHKCLKLAKQLGNGLYLHGSYFSVAITYTAAKRHAEAQHYFKKIYEIVDVSNWPTAMKQGAEALHYSSLIESKQFKEAKAFYNAHPQVAAWHKSTGQENELYMARAQIFEGEGQLDSAHFYYQKAIAYATEVKSPYAIQDNRTRYGAFLLKQGEVTAAIQEFEKAKVAGLELQDPVELKLTLHYLDTAYAIIGNTKEAYRYHLLHDKYEDSLQSLSDKNQLTLLEMESEEKRLQLLQQREEASQRRRHNLQYMGISAGIAIVFILLALMGLFSTATAVIRGIGFFAFIFFFEFIILLADHEIHTWTHGEPWKVLAIKIGLIAILLPLHHLVEERVVHYLIHHKKITLSKWLFKSRYPTNNIVTPNSGNSLANK